MAPSSSGSGHLVLIQKIAGSNPAGVTKKRDQVYPGLFSWLITLELAILLRVSISK